jgi:putative GTP pyrophosphokinase
MEVDSGFRQAYDNACADLIDLGPVVVGLLKELLRASTIRVHSVDHRVKTQPDLRRKLSEKGTSYDSLADVHDLLGVRIITFFPDEVDVVADLVERQFEIDRTNSVDKRALLDPDRFGYLSRHYVVCLNEDRTQLAEHARFADQKFEIQIRSILQHAWAEIEHDLGYHTQEAVPREIRRRFSRLAGLLEIADSEFQAIRDNLQEYRGSVSEVVEQSPYLVAVNRDSMAALIRTSDLVRAIDEELADVVDLPLRPPPDEESTASARVAVALALDLRTIGAVTTALKRERDALRRFYRSWIEGVRSPEFVTYGLSIFLLGYLFAGRSGSREEVEEYLGAANIGFGGGERAQIVTRVLAAAARAEGSEDLDADR